jgi:hypothetical protein
MKNVDLKENTILFRNNFAIIRVEWNKCCLCNLSFYCRKDPQPVPFCTRFLLLQAVAVSATGARPQETGGGLPGAAGAGLQARVSFETSFDSKQPKVVSALSVTKLVSVVSLLYRNREFRCFD